MPEDDFDDSVDDGWDSEDEFDDHEEPDDEL